jgi:SAM-dependent methyltransferase
MGVLTTTAEFIVQARAGGASFERTLTLGRQSMFVSPVRLARLMKRYGVFPAGTPDEAFYRGLYSSPYYADGFFAALGARELSSMDFSAYEGAAIVHDLNQPIAATLREQFDAVCDIGTLEHVFNFPVAIRNCMEMVKVGGRLFVATPANNFFGHGFYQFSAELFYRVLSPANGFEVERMIARENEIFGTRLPGRTLAMELKGRPYSVSDPAQVHDRVQLDTRYPVTLFVQARRTAVRPIFESTPQQSDYVSAWDSAAAAPRASNGAAAPEPGAAPAPHPPAAPHQQLPFSPRWARLKDYQLHWLPLLARTLCPPIFRWKARERRLGRRATNDLHPPAPWNAPR